VAIVSKVLRSKWAAVPEVVQMREVGWLLVGFWFSGQFFMKALLSQRFSEPAPKFVEELTED
jgi:hypothetical protein